MNQMSLPASRLHSLISKSCGAHLLTAPNSDNKLHTEDLSTSNQKRRFSQHEVERLDGSADKGRPRKQRRLNGGRGYNHDEVVKDIPPETAGIADLSSVDLEVTIGNGVPSAGAPKVSLRPTLLMFDTFDQSLQISRKMSRFASILKSWMLLSETSDWSVSPPSVSTAPLWPMSIERFSLVPHGKSGPVTSPT